MTFHVKIFCWDNIFRCLASKKVDAFFLWIVSRNSWLTTKNIFKISPICYFTLSLLCILVILWLTHFFKHIVFYHWNAGYMFRFSASDLSNMPPYLNLTLFFVSWLLSILLSWLQNSFIIFILWLLITMFPNKLFDSMNITLYVNKNFILLKVHILI